MTKRLVLDPRIGEPIAEMVEQSTGEDSVHIILIAFADDGDDLSEPAIVTSFSPEMTEQILVRIGQRLPSAEKTVTGQYDTRTGTEPKKH